MYLCYVAGPYRALTVSGVEQNVRNASDEACYLWRNGFSVICPHKNTEGFANAIPNHHEVCIAGDIEQVIRSDIIIMLPNWELSMGSIQENDAMKDVGGLILFRNAYQDIHNGRVQGYTFTNSGISVVVHLRDGKIFDARDKEYIKSREHPLIIGVYDDLKPTSP